MRRALWTGLMAIAVVACGRMPGSDAEDDGAARPLPGSHAAQIEHWRQQRYAELRAPDGWLSLTGSGLLKPGTWHVGASADSQPQLPGGPAQLGTLVIDDAMQVRFTAAPGSGARLAGMPLGSQPRVLNPERAGVAGDHLQVGSSQFYVVRTGELLGWRFRDAQAPALKAFAGIEHFPVDEHWRIEAAWYPYPQPKPVTLMTSIGTPLHMVVPGEAVFHVDGQRFRLLPVMLEGAPRMTIVFADRTSGKETHGGARYLRIAPPQGDSVVLDFNRAENPPCALTRHVVCPIAPPVNRLDLAITAGEKTYVASQ